MLNYHNNDTQTKVLEDYTKTSKRGRATALLGKMAELKNALY
jgi:hypothetical protein